jgi:hypothetical protein
MKPTIVICVYNRPSLLFRLLSSIQKGKFLQGASLIISIDFSEDQAEIVKMLDDFEWIYGDFHLIIHSANLGLREHVLYCGDLTKEFGDVILLEEDLYVSPAFYNFAIEATKFYRDDSRISGISLYDHRYCETSQLQFEKINHSNSDVYFMQLASSWGQVWTQEQWAKFREWYEKNKVWTKTQDVPQDISHWPETSWKKYFVRYNIENDLYFVYPRSSLSTNFCDPGTHHKTKRAVFQAPLETNPSRLWVYEKLENSVAVYNAACEMTAQSLVKWSGLRIDAEQLEVDLYGVKKLEDIKKKYLITTRQSNSPIAQFALELKPKELNVFYALEGKEIVLAETSSFTDNRTINITDERRYYHGFL